MKNENHQVLCSDKKFKVEESSLKKKKPIVNPKESTQFFTALLTIYHRFCDAAGDDFEGPASTCKF